MRVWCFFSRPKRETLVSETSHMERKRPPRSKKTKGGKRKGRVHNPRDLRPSVQADSYNDETFGEQADGILFLTFKFIYILSNFQITRKQHSPLSTFCIVLLVYNCRQ